MNNRADPTNMKSAKKRALKPKLRFPEFQGSLEWEERKLGDFASLVSERAGGREYTLMSVTAGVGLVTQVEKFGKEIAGNSYRNYFVIREGDFAYNKSATKYYPEGFISMLEGRDSAAVPNSIFICFRVEDEGISRQLLKQMFLANFHGHWLRRFITIGARAHGALNVNPDDLMRMPIKIPVPEEQQKIADCLSSLDELIAAHNQKLDALNAHKQGLLQQLFPAEGETLPKLRFPEFRDALEWENEPLGGVYSFKATNSFSRSKLNYENGSVKNIHYGDIHTKFSTLFNIDEEVVPFINPSESLENIDLESYCLEGDIVFADASEDVEDVGKSIEIVHLNNEQLLAGLHTILARQKEKRIVVGFGGYLFRSNRIRVRVRKEAQGAKVAGISAGRISNIEICFPSDKKEQQKIADCLSSLDELIAAHNQKLDALKVYKKGLMQQLFPLPEEVWR